MRTKSNHFKRRMALYGVLLIAVYLLQYSQGMQITLYGARMDILPFFIAAIALFEGPLVGCAFGTAIGLISCINISSAEGLLALYYGLCGLGLGYFAPKYMRKVFPSTFFCGTLIFAVKTIIVFCFYYALVYKAASLQAFKFAGFQLFLSWLFAVPLHFIIKKISTTFEDMES